MGVLEKNDHILTVILLKNSAYAIIFSRDQIVDLKQQFKIRNKGDHCLLLTGRPPRGWGWSC